MLKLFAVLSTFKFFYIIILMIYNINIFGSVLSKIFRSFNKAALSTN